MNEQANYIFSRNQVRKATLVKWESEKRNTIQKGSQNTDPNCQRVVLLPGNGMLARQKLDNDAIRQNGVGSKNESPVPPSSLGEQTFSMFFGDLYNTIIWDAIPKDRSIALWPYLHEVLMFGKCMESSCTSRKSIKKIYEETIPNMMTKDSGRVIMEAVGAGTPAGKWTKEAMTKVLSTCAKTPVFFTNTSKTEDPAWIVSNQDGDGWQLDLVRSLDQEQRSEIYSLDDIFSKVLPDYPDIVYVDGTIH
ncbi:hypothetical protein QFC22_003763 [Naganishia vaughanmartiniae]|uniref:Uncharacterized protein n=1 Tax=Naganishia vaughanmartiniae TaxID=1424756 RepID=A0ACC2X5D3_9TREE|nr:hypothetical protein QFC22_003763 [Naganishia vaughanmartiniae]